MRKPFGFYRDLRMHYKLFLQYLLLLVLPFIVFIIVNYRFTSKDLESQTLYSSQQAFEQSRSYMEFKLFVAKNFLTILSSNDKLQEILHNDSGYYDNNYGLWSFDVEEIRRQFYITKPSEDIMKISLYTSQAVTTANETDDVMKLERISGMPWYTNLTKSSTTFELFPNTIVSSRILREEIPTIAVARSIYDNASLQNAIGVLSVDIPKSNMETILGRVANTKSSSAFLIDRSGTIIAQSSKAVAAILAFLSTIPGMDALDKLKQGVWSKEEIEGADYLVGAQNLEDTDWVLVSLTPYHEILESQRKAMRRMLLNTLIIAAFLLPLAYVAAASGTRRIRGLISQMKSVKQGDFDIRIPHEGKDEIGELSWNFKSMIAKVTQLLDEKYALGQEVKSLELKALQAQINPHFLYNTLDLVYWKAMRQEQGIDELVHALSTFYKLSLSKGEDIVCLRNEVDHIQAYVDIQNARYKNAIALIVHIPEDLLDCKIPKITLQPLVENAIIHGILETENGTGTIVIRAKADGGKLFIHVTDDGAGMSGDHLGAIFHTKKTDPFRGFGANNINKRIKLLYGEEYGLTYRHNDTAGITAVISLPL